MTQPPADQGFSLLESLLALLLMLIVMSGVFAIVTPNSIASQAQPEAMDVQQRARVGIDAVERDLLQAGAGLATGPGAGPIVDYFPAIVPRRMGLHGTDPYDVARPDAVTISHVTPGYVETTIKNPIAAGELTMTMEEPGSCPVRNGVCGLSRDMKVVVFEDTGVFDWFSIGQVQSPMVTLVAHQSSPSSAYPAGTHVAQGEVDVYWLDPTTRQLRHYDGYQTDVAVVDNVVALSFEYFGDPQPPTRPKPPLGVANCLYDAAGNAVPGLITLVTQGGSLAPLPLSMLGDGPWCGAGDNRFDADLLRVRSVRVSVRVQATQPVYRGSGMDFASPGSNRNAWRAVADYAAVFDVMPRNLNLRR
jgi:prepilin-type N-terminal cleavage/methylation domain-containing protein